MDALPQWTTKVDKRGLDPLGMQNAGIVLYQALLPGISNITLRMRYYGFFCWLSDAYARRGVKTDFELWRQWVRRAEALFALVCADVSGQGGIGGIDWAEKALQIEDELIDFADAASTDKHVKRYLIQSLGVFGAAYYTQMMEMGLFEHGTNGIQKITPSAGLTAANAFRAAIGSDIEAKFIAAIDSAKINRATLISLRPMVPSRINDPSDERACYEDVLFSTGPKNTDKSRRESLILFLEVAGQNKERPTPESVRWSLFNPPANELSQDLEAQRLLWETYQCQDLLQVAAAGLLGWAISIMRENDIGATIDEIRGAVETRLAEAEPELTGITWANLRDGTDIDTFAWRASWDKLIGKRGSPEQKAWDTVSLMAALHRRIVVRDDLHTAMNKALPFKGKSRSIVTELLWFDHNEDRPVAEVIGDYVVERVVQRHSWVAMQKLRRQRDYTFLFEVRDSRLVALSGYQPVPTTPRLAPAIQFLEDIHLVGLDGLTARGRALLGANR